MKKFHRDSCFIYFGDALELYKEWKSPISIISDGPYGLKSFPGDPPSYELLSEWYEPHIKEWSKYSSPLTTLWFWNSEIGWATVHPILKKYGWEYRNCHIWNKGIGHIAGNSNSKTLRKFPVVTEVCVQYVKIPEFKTVNKILSMKEWLRYEWERTGLPFSKTNEACNVKDAATRKYFSKDYLWYYPPPDAFELLVKYANKFGKKEGIPYFSIDNKKSLSKEEWANMRSKFNFSNGITNVWNEPPVRGIERYKKAKNKCLHMNQKPLKLIELCIKSTTDINDVVWEPFGGLCSGAIASYRLKRICYSSEILEEYYNVAKHRLEFYDLFSEQD